MKRIKVTIAYDGTKYSGWQIQKNAITIQSQIEKACHNLFSQEINIIGASRTDAGVHALGQVATLDIDTTIPSERIAYALNAQLPEDIVIQRSEEVYHDFHPRYDAIMKTYEYVILNHPTKIPQFRDYTHFVSNTLNTHAMRDASNYLVGTKDFKSFCAANSSVKSTVRTIFSCEIVKEEPLIKVCMTGNGFLYNMVRIIAGTLIEVGKEKLKPSDVKWIIEQEDRSYASATAPAKGLTLVNIKYDM